MSETKNIHTELSRIQQAIRVGKEHRNEFGKYNYRNTSDILEALKPLLGGCAIRLTDSLKEVCGRIYVEATAELSLDGQAISTTAYAREAEAQKGMVEAQITGSTSTYARKYALNGLLAIDDTADADTTNTGQEVERPKNKPSGKPKPSSVVQQITELAKSRPDVDWAALKSERWDGDSKEGLLRLMEEHIAQEF